MPGPNPRLVSLHVWGDFACFTRPEHKVERMSYPVPTPSAARGIFEAVFYEPEMYYIIHSIGIVKRSRWFSLARNEVKYAISSEKVEAAMRSGGLMAPMYCGASSEAISQRNMIGLADVDYVITAEIRLTARAKPPRANLAKYYDMLIDRAQKGKVFHRPFFGCREFPVSFEYLDDPASVPLCASEWASEDLGLMLYDVFDPFDRATGLSQKPDPIFFRARVQDARINTDPYHADLFRPDGVSS